MTGGMRFLAILALAACAYAQVRVAFEDTPEYRDCIQNDCLRLNVASNDSFIVTGTLPEEISTISSLTSLCARS